MDTEDKNNTENKKGMVKDLDSGIEKLSVYLADRDFEKAQKLLDELNKNYPKSPVLSIYQERFEKAIARDDTMISFKKEE